MIYNHSDDHNAVWTTDADANGDAMFIIRAIREIQPGEEILINYGEGYWSGGWPKF